MLIYGIKETEGIPEELNGFQWENIDENIRTLTSLIRDRSEPPITIFEPYYFQLSDSERFVLIIKVQKSWNGPHRVKMNGKKEFYTRIKNKSDPMKIEDLRISFNLSETLIERIRRFRESRISELYVNNTPVPFEDCAKLVIHLVPLNAFNPGQVIDIHPIIEDLNQITYTGAHGLNKGYNMDGIIAYTGTYSSRPSYSYVQFFRNGILEIVYGHEEEDEEDNALMKHIFAIYDEKDIVESISKNMKIFKKIGVETPIFVFITLLNIQDFQMPVSSSFQQRRLPKIYKDILVLPEVLLNSYDVNIGNSLKNPFNVVWNAFGRAKSPNYDENGEWNPTD